MENQEITIKLTSSAWNSILNILAQRPFAEVATLIGAIKSQAETQINNSATVDTE